MASGLGYLFSGSLSPSSSSSLRHNSLSSSSPSSPVSTSSSFEPSIDSPLPSSSSLINQEEEEKKKRPWFISLLPSVFSENPLFNAGVGLALLGAGASLVRRGGEGLRHVARRRLFTSLEISVRDPAYPWVMQWLVQRGRMSHHLGVCTEYCKDSAGNVEALFNFVPSPGRHVLRYKKSFVVVERSRSGEILDLQTGTPWETLTLHTLSLQRHILKEI
ncbi:bcs1 family isoform 9, partial [Cystoisospora suis]